ncbi:MAG: hypothetical protein M1374_05010 [Firmicutes bacterium]|nr:hypothetical protein [Bacillota bacterium]
MKNIKFNLLLAFSTCASLFLFATAAPADTVNTSYVHTANTALVLKYKKTKTTFDTSLTIVPGESLNTAKDMLEKAIAVRELTLEHFSNALRNTDILSRQAYENLIYEIANARQGLATLEVTVTSAELLNDLLDVPAQIHTYGVFGNIKQQLQLYESAISIHKRLNHLLNLESTLEAAVAALVVSKPNLVGIQSIYLNFSNNLSAAEQNINGVFNTIAGMNQSLFTMTESQLSLCNQLINNANTNLTIAKKELHKILSAISTESVNLHTNHDHLNNRN